MQETFHDWTSNYVHFQMFRVRHLARYSKSKLPDTGVFAFGEVCVDAGDASQSYGMLLTNISKFILYMNVRNAAFARYQECGAFKEHAPLMKYLGQFRHTLEPNFPWQRGEGAPPRCP